jgi:hypothetical protein
LKSSTSKTLIAAFLFSLFAMAPVLSHFSTRKFGPNVSGVGSDSYSYIYRLWLNAQPVDGRIRTADRDLLSGFPEGRPIIPQLQIGSMISWELSKIGWPAEACYNLIIWLNFMIAFALLFRIGQELRLSDDVALLAAFMAASCPYQSLQSVDHIDLATTGAVLLNIYFLTRLFLRRDGRAVPWLILLTGLAVFAHPYYLICLALLNALPLLWAAGQVAHGRLVITKRGWWATTAAALIAAGSVAFWKSFFTTTQGHLEGLQRDISELYIYSTKLWDFLLPPHYSALFSHLTNATKMRVTAESGSNFVENTLYPGAVTLLAVAAVALIALFRPRRAGEWLRGNRGLALLLAALTALPILFSVSPTLDIFRFEVTTPTWFIYQVLPQFRTMSRFGYVTDVSLILIFALALESALRRWRPRRTVRTAALTAITVFCVFDFGYVHQNFYTDSRLVPAVYPYLKEHTPPEATIFEVPMIWGYVTTYWQRVHQRRNFGLFEPGHPKFVDMIMTTKMDFAGLVNFCRANGIDYLLLHTNDPVDLPGLKFENQPDERWAFFLFAHYSYLVKIADLK